MTPLALTLPGDITIMTPPRLHCMTTWVLLEQEDWFEDDIRFLRRAIGPGSKVIDIGANFGIFTLTLAKQIGADGHVWAIEPAAETAGYLRQSIARNGFTNADVIQAALSDRDTTGFLAHGFSQELSHVADVPSDDGEEIALMTLDRVVADCGNPTIDFIKLDAEGHEMAVLAGAQQLLAKQAPVIMLEVLGKDAQLHLDPALELVKQGYHLFRLMPGLMMLVPLHLDDARQYRLVNVFALKPQQIAIWHAMGWLAYDMVPPATVNSMTMSDLWRMAHDVGLSPEIRHGCFMEAFVMAEDHYAARQDPATILNLIRLCYDTGYSCRVTNLAEQALSLIEQGATYCPSASDLPFMPNLVDAVPQDNFTLQKALITLIDRKVSYTSLLRMQNAWDVNSSLLKAGDNSLPTLRRMLLLLAAWRQAVPQPWTEDARLLDPDISPHAHIWSGTIEMDCQN